MSSQPNDPRPGRDAADDELDWVDRLSVERRRRSREWEEAFGDPGPPAPDGGPGSAAPRTGKAPVKDTSFFDQDDPPKPARRRRRGTAPESEADRAPYDQDGEPGT